MLISDFFPNLDIEFKNLV